MDYLFAVLSGALAINAVPHLVFAFNLQNHRTIFSRNSSPMTNFFWAYIQIIISALLFAEIFRVNFANFMMIISVLAGVGVLGFLDVLTFAKMAENSRKNNKNGDEK